MANLWYIFTGNGRLYVSYVKHGLHYGQGTFTVIVLNAPKLFIFLSIAPKMIHDQ